MQKKENNKKKTHLIKMVTKRWRDNNDNNDNNRKNNMPIKYATCYFNNIMISIDVVLFKNLADNSMKKKRYTNANKESR